MPVRGGKRNLLTLSTDEDLLRALETKEWGRPLALGAVIRDAVAKKEMIPQREFMASVESIYHRSWSVSPWQIISWGLRQMGAIGGDPVDDKMTVDKLVVVANMEEATKEISHRIAGKTSRIESVYSKDLFYQECASAMGAEYDLSDTDMDVLLKFLSRDKGLISYDGQTIKLKAYSDPVASPITTEDTTIASLRTLMISLESQISALAQKVDDLSNAARDAVSRKNRVSALAALRSKKFAETTLSKRTATLSQLEEVYSSIEQAADQVELVRVMEASTVVLKSLNTRVGGVERVDTVVDKLQEQMTEVNEIDHIIREVGQSGVVDQAEVDDELEAMEREEKQKKEEADRLEQEECERREVAETKQKLAELGRHEAAAKEPAAKEAIAKVAGDEITLEPSVMAEAH